MGDKTSLGDRMKEYEAVTRGYVMRRTPTIIRVDGNAFHSFTKQITPALDRTEAYGPGQKYHDTMVNTAYAVFARMQNCVFAYTQSDEISFLLRDWDKHETQQWFGGGIQKMASIAAGMTTSKFIHECKENLYFYPDVWFDARVFNLPYYEVDNYFIWRQQDATRNAIQMIARKHFSHKELLGKSSSEMQEMLFHKCDCNFNDYATWKRRGTCIYKDVDGMITVDEEIPIFTKDRKYINKHLVVEDE